MKPKILLLSAALLAPPATFAAEQKATFAAGCFWCMEAIFERVPGVTDVVSGYAGGDEANPTNKQVGGGHTGHAEAIEITYDDMKTNYSKLLDVFWKSHDPTDARGVAPDFGKQYRSALFYRTQAEKVLILKSKAAVENKLGKKVATEVAELKKFWPAEGYHQDYVRKNPNDRYVTGVSIPRLKETFGK